MKYHKWILKFKGQDSYLGDLANDISHDKRFPVNAEKPSEVREYLQRRSASRDAISAFETSWKRFKRELRK